MVFPIIITIALFIIIIMSSEFKVRVALESDYVLLADFNILMAKETEAKDLDREVV